MNKKIFIIYYSWSGNTGNIAKLIQQETGSQLFEVNPVQSYPINYGVCVEQAKKEIYSGFMPKLEAIPNNLDSYDIIFIGTPIWWHTMAPPVFTFLSHVDLSGKTVVPFCTHGGGGKGDCINDIAKLCKNSIILDELEMYGDGGKSARLDVQAWLNRIGIKENL